MAPGACCRETAKDAAASLQGATLLAGQGWAAVCAANEEGWLPVAVARLLGTCRATGWIAMCATFTLPASLCRADELIGGVIITLGRVFASGFDDVRAPLRSRDGKAAGELNIILKWTPEGGAAPAGAHKPPPMGAGTWAYAGGAAAGGAVAGSAPGYPPSGAAAGGYPPPAAASAGYPPPAGASAGYPPPAGAAAGYPPQASGSYPPSAPPAPAGHSYPPPAGSHSSYGTTAAMAAAGAAAGAAMAASAAPSGYPPPVPAGHVAPPSYAAPAPAAYGAPPPTGYPGAYGAPPPQYGATGYPPQPTYVAPQPGAPPWCLHVAAAQIQKVHLWVESMVRTHSGS